MCVCVRPAGACGRPARARPNGVSRAAARTSKTHRRGTVVVEDAGSRVSREHLLFGEPVLLSKQLPIRAGLRYRADTGQKCVRAIETNFDYVECNNAMRSSCRLVILCFPLRS